MNENINLMINNPKKSIRTLSFPLIINNLLLLLNTIIDGIWITGLNVESLIAMALLIIGLVVCSKEAPKRIGETFV